MQPELSSSLAQSAAALFGIDASNLTALDATENLVYGFHRTGVNGVLRLTPASRRSIRQLEGELDFVSFLADSAVAVARPLASFGPQRVARVPSAHGDWYGVAFERAPGRHLEPAQCRSSLLRIWGRLFAHIHSATANYRRGLPDDRRPHWYQDEQLDIPRYVPRAQQRVYEVGSALMERLRGLPVSREEYGLIHSDLHLRNFVYDQGRITAFDFDDCGYNWFVQDIATALYYFVRRVPDRERRPAHAERFLRYILQGYREVRELDPDWLMLIPEFLRLRHILMYVLEYQKRGATLVESDQRVHQLRLEIEQESSCLDLTRLSPQALNGQSDN